MENHSRKTFNGTAQPSRVTNTRNMASYVYPEPSYGSKGWIWLEDGAISFVSRPSLYHALRLRLQDVAQRAL